MSKLSYLFLILLFTQSLCQETEVVAEGETKIEITSKWSLEPVESFDVNSLEGTWNIQGAFFPEDVMGLQHLLFTPIDVKILGEDQIELTFRYFNSTSLEWMDQNIKFTHDVEKPGVFRFDEKKEDYFTVIFYEQISTLMSSEVRDEREMEGELEREIELEGLEMEGEMGEEIGVGSGVIEEDRMTTEGDIIILEVVISESHFIMCLSRKYDGIYDLRRFLREREIKYLINKDFFQFPILEKFKYTVPESYKEPTLEGDWLLLGVYETEDHARLFPWDLSYCPKISFKLIEEKFFEIELDLDLLYSGRALRKWTLFPKEDEKGVVVGFVSDRPLPIGVLDINENGLLVAITNDGAAFLVATPDWKGEELLQDDINYFRDILNNNLESDLIEFYLHFFYKDECVEKTEEMPVEGELGE